MKLLGMKKEFPSLFFKRAKAIIFASIFAIICTTYANPSLALQDGKYLYNSCDLALKMKRGKNLSPFQSTIASECVNYISGFRDALAVQNMITKSKGGSADICIPNNISTGDLAQIIVKHMDGQPSSNDDSPATITAVSFIDAFDC